MTDKKEEFPIEKNSKENSIKELFITGILEIHKNFGFIRTNEFNYSKTDNDCYVNNNFLNRYNLKDGDIISGYQIKNKLKSIEEINGLDPNSE